MKTSQLLTLHFPTLLKMQATSMQSNASMLSISYLTYLSCYTSYFSSDLVSFSNKPLQ